jgi:CHAT domain-containing protein/Tfp pilus assembly protein PilF
MRATAVTRRLLGLWLALTPALLPAQPDASGAVKAALPSLNVAADEDVPQALAPGQVRRHTLMASAGEYVRVYIRGEDIELAARIVAPDGEAVAESLSTRPRPILSREVLRFVAATSGEHRIEIRALRASGREGRYVWQVTERGPAGEKERRRVRAQSWLQEADRLALADAVPPLASAPSLATAQTRAEEALTLAREARDVWGQVQAYHLLGAIEERRGRTSEALQHHALAESYSLHLSPLCEGVALVDRCSPDFGYFEKRATLGVHEALLDLYGVLELEAGQVSSLNHLANVYSDLGEKGKALQLYRKALEQTNASSQPKQRAALLHNTGALYLSIGAYEQALRSFKDAIAIWRSAGLKESEAASLSQMARALTALDRLPAARRHGLRAVSLAREAEDGTLESNSLHSVAEAYAALGQRQQAVEAYERVLQLRRRNGDRLGEATALVGLGTVWEALDRAADAFSTFERASEIARSGSVPSVQAQALFGLARVERGRGRLTAARERIESAIAILESMRDRLNEDDLRASLLASAHAYYDFYVELLMELHALEPGAGYDAAAFEASERARTRCLLEALADLRHRVRLDLAPDLFERLRSVRERLRQNAEQQRQLQLRVHEPDDEAQLKSVAEELQKEQQEVQRAVLAASPRYAELMQARPLSLRELREQVLDDETVLLQYALGERRSFLWVVTPTSIRSLPLPARTEVEALARPVYAALTARNDGARVLDAVAKTGRVRRADAEYPRLARALSRMLLGPVYDQLAGKRLLVVADGVLHYIPFGALPAPDPAGSKQQAPPPLILRHEIVHAPSASSVALLRQETATRPRPAHLAAILADPVFALDDPRVTSGTHARRQAAHADPTLLRSLGATTTTRSAGFARLPFTREEAAAIATLVPESERMQALDFAASRSAALDPRLGSYRIVHFATHALVNSREPALSGIVLSLIDERGRVQDGFLRLNEIYDLKLSADLVVLSACRTALGREVYGEGLIGLTRGFMYAGAPRVLSSLWNVDDKATSELMQRVYAAMLGERRLPPAAALRTAQIALMQQERWRSPYYWAGFTLQGEWR